MGIGTKARITAACLGLILVSGCAEIIRNHGYVPAEAELQEITVGVDSRQTVEDVLGAPSSSALLQGGDIYYVRSQVRHFGAMRPKVIDREVVAISFDEAGVVQNIERFGLKDGQVVPLARRVTSSSVEGKGFIRQLMGAFGNFSPTQAFGGTRN
ncbi:outer membrane protein assembly factor BamE [Marimonas lutisalis]|uniref:outer membrane protein assembly factor BamE n=1 Tax=Marimonas lutisalis TaxID=2545756 RepID=UPI0010F53C75|nr:outer membrane protein assembly factor BamE [Marimonas lutisalis]